MKDSRADKVFNIMNYAIMSVIILLVAYPLYFVLIASLSDPYEIVNGNVYLWIKGFTLESYEYVLGTSSIWTGYLNTIINTSLATAYNLMLTIPAAYVLSKKELPLGKTIMWYFFITMYFYGGMIPTYLLYKDFGLLNTRWSLILTSISCYNLIVCRTFFSTSIPNSLYEAAYIDGASQLRCFFQIAVPLASPIIAVIALFCAATQWNSYYSAMLYIRKQYLYPLQLVLRDILISAQNAYKNIDTSAVDEDVYAAVLRKTYLAESMKYAVIFIASAPLLAAYPFVQKYFVKGVMVGSIKG
jgi:putative aldouronate transport system permease protein